MKTGKISEFKLAWMPLPLFIVLFVVLILSQITGSLKANLYTGLMICALFGCLMRSVVDNVPLIKKTLGGSFVAFACAFLVFFNLIPDTWIEACNTFINGDIDFLTCFVMTLICGSILSMDRDLLIAVGVRYFVPVILGIVISYSLAACVGQVMGLGWKHTLLYIAGPIMGGGNGAGSMPMSEIYAGITGEDQGAVYSQLHAMVTLGNWLSIGGAVILNIVGEKFKSTTGNGKLLKNGNVNAGEVTYDFTFELSDLLIGICLVSGVFLTGRILSKIFPVVHAYAWSIVFVAVIKILNLVPKKWEFAAYKLYQFVNSKCQIILTAARNRYVESRSTVRSAYGSEPHHLYGDCSRWCDRCMDRRKNRRILSSGVCNHRWFVHEQCRWIRRYLCPFQCGSYGTDAICAGIVQTWRCDRFGTAEHTGIDVVVNLKL